MQFQDVLKYLEQMVGLNLQPINDSNEPLVILSIDFEKSNYTVEKTSTTKRRTRPFVELQKILTNLNQKGYTSVDQALGGAGSSRHQPETIFANFPCIEHFKYEKKKHLFLREVNTHQIGSSKELDSSEARNIKKRIDRYRDFDISQFYHLHREQTQDLKNSLNNIFTKYPGEADVDTATETLKKIEDLEIKLSEAIVNLEQSQLAWSSADDDDSISTVKNGDGDDDDDDDQGQVDIEFSQHVKGIVPTRITQVSPTVSLLYDRVQHDEIDLKPEYQRKEKIWPIKDQARLIESILLGLPLPAFYFAERPNVDPRIDSDFIWVVIDGLQRTTTLVEFMKGEFELKELAQLPHYNLHKFKDLPRKEQRKIREYQIHGHLIQVSNDSEEMIRELFHRINTYGKNLTYQEIRSALYPGSATRFLKYFASESAFIDGVPAKINSDRMLDVEYVLRAVSYLVLGFSGYNYKTNDDFLCHTLKKLNAFKYDDNKSLLNSDMIFNDIDYRLKESMRVITVIFGDDAYKKESNGKLNKILFELLVSVFSLMNDEQRKLASSEVNSDLIRRNLWRMIEDDENTAEWESDVYKEQGRGFNYSISNSTGKRVTVLYRFRSIVNMLNNIDNFDFSPVGLLEK
ncbi:DUF262 domain-containing protein [Vibrio cyclitrophicus]|nr:DUF262 domain-containing protein [Vibrio cyclitrophicus]PME18651.1 hypothetical protein BCV41_09380 [Vibrio cyclitrophicus]